MVAVTWPCVVAIAVPAWLVGTLAAWAIVAGGAIEERRDRERRRRALEELERQWEVETSWT